MLPVIGVEREIATVLRTILMIRGSPFEVGCSTQRLQQTGRSESRLQRSESEENTCLSSVCCRLSVLFTQLLSYLLSPSLPSHRVATEPSRHGKATAGGDRYLHQHHGGGRGRRRTQARGTAQRPILFPFHFPLFNSESRIWRNRLGSWWIWSRWGER